jgi:hypothetical protein
VHRGLSLAVRSVDVTHGDGLLENRTESAASHVTYCQKMRQISILKNLNAITKSKLIGLATKRDVSRSNCLDVLHGILFVKNKEQ